MKRSGGRHGVRKFARYAAEALTGRLGLAATVLAYASCALVLLAYVSTQVYTFSLMEEIGSLEQKQRTLKEQVGLLTEQYAGLAAMERITRICRDDLGMVPADAGGVVRVAVDRNWAPRRDGERGAEAPVDLPGMMGSSIDQITEVIRR